MTEALGIQLQGRLHSGIDDASTMAAVLQRIISMTVGSGSSANIVGFPSALNWKTMVDSFAAQRGVHLRIDSMPFKASETDVLDWLSRMGAEIAPVEIARGIDKTRLALVRTSCYALYICTTTITAVPRTAAATGSSAGRVCRFT